MSGWVAAAAEPTDWARGLVGVAFGLVSAYAGHRAWSGRWPGPFGPRPRYQTVYGGAHLAIPAGAWMLLLGGGEIIRGALGLERDGLFFMTVAIVSTALLVLTLLYGLAYFWTGVPPRMRPPHQRDQRAVGEGRVRSRLARLRHHR